MVYQTKTGGTWYYDIQIDRKRYKGTCESCTTRRQAEAFERALKDKTKQASGLKSVKTLYETFREDLTGGKKIYLDDAFELSLKKPRKRIPAEKKMGLKRGVWRDFLAFMHAEHPDILYSPAGSIPRCLRRIRIENVFASGSFRAVNGRA